MLKELQDVQSLARLHLHVCGAELEGPQVEFLDGLLLPCPPRAASVQVLPLRSGMSGLPLLLRHLWLVLLVGATLFADDLGSVFLGQTFSLAGDAGDVTRGDVV